MNQEKNPVNKKSHSPEKLNEYIRIGSTGGYLLITGLVILAAALVVWGFAGRIPVIETLAGAVVGTENKSNSCLCFIDVNYNIQTIDEGDPVTVSMMDKKTFSGTVSFAGNIAKSAEDARKMYSLKEDYSPLGLTDWMMDNLLDDSKYIYPVYIQTDEDISDYWHQMAIITVVTNEVRPISYLLR